MLSSGQAQQIFSQLIPMNGGENLWIPTQKLEVYWLLLSSMRTKRVTVLPKLISWRVIASRDLAKQVEEEGPLTPEAQEQIRNDLRSLASLSMSYRTILLSSIDEAEAAMAEKEVRLLIAQGAFIPEGLLKQVTDNTLYKQAYQLNATRRVNGL